MPWRPRIARSSRRRRAVLGAAALAHHAAATVTAAVLLFVVGYILVRGVPALTPDLFQWEYTSEKRVASAGARLDGHHGAAGFGAGGARGRWCGYLPGGVRPRGPLCAPGARDRRDAAGHSLHHLRPVRHAVLRDGLRLGPLVLLSGACTLAIMVLPVIMRTTEEALMGGGPIPTARAASASAPGGCARWPAACCPRRCPASWRRHFGPRPLRGRGGGLAVHRRHRGPNPRLRRPGHLRPLRLLAAPWPCTCTPWPARACT